MNILRMSKTMFYFLIIINIVNISYSQKSLHLGLGLGASLGINESKKSERSPGLLLGGNILYKNGFGNNFTPELNFQSFSNGTSNGTYSEYKTNYLAPEFRLRYELGLEETRLRPYFFTGVGVTIFDVVEIPRNREPQAKLNGSAVHFPVGGGASYPIDKNIIIDLNISYNITATDDLNPIWDDINDANLNLRLGAYFKIYDFTIDTDGDGLSDEKEIELGTNPSIPDSDNDGLSDGEEFYDYKTNPLDADTDGGGVKDGVEVLNGADPLNPDDDILNVAVGEKVNMRNLEFETGLAVISPRSEKLLNLVLKSLQSDTDMEFVILGHTDDVGERDFNMKLSLDRGTAVQKWLVDKGIKLERLPVEGKGPDAPLVPNSSDLNRQKNRRVEFARTK